MKQNKNQQPNLSKQPEEFLVSFLQSKKPKVAFNEKFRQNLRNQILNLPKQQNKSLNFINMFTSFSKFMVPLLVVAIIAAGTGFFVARQSAVNPIKQFADSITKTDYAIANVEANSFGSLTKLASNQASANAAAPLSDNLQQKQAAGNSITAYGEASVPPGAGGGSDLSMIYVPEYYSFKYDGADFSSLLSENVPVYKRAKSNTSSSYLDQLLKTFSFGLINLNTLDGASLQNYSLLQDKEFGYSVYVDLVEQTVNMNQNWQRWPQPAVCKEIAPMDTSMPAGCPENFGMKIENMPPDNEVITAAENFLQEYEVSLAGYGSAVVDNQWRVAYKDAVEKKLAYPYVPEILDVVFPYNIEDKNVYEESGYFAGLHVNYNVREKKVIGFYDLRGRQYQKSNYTGETEIKRLTDIAERGGFRNYNYYATEDGGKKIQLNLDQPSLQVMRFWKYDNNQSTELFVPALVFPIKNRGNYWRSNVIVPLVKEVLDGENNVPYPMPLGAPAAESSSGEQQKVILPGSTDTIEPS